MMSADAGGLVVQLLTMLLKLVKHVEQIMSLYCLLLIVLLDASSHAVFTHWKVAFLAARYCLPHTVELSSGFNGVKSMLGIWAAGVGMTARKTETAKRRDDMVDAVEPGAVDVRLGRERSSFSLE